MDHPESSFVGDLKQEHERLGQRARVEIGDIGPGDQVSVRAGEIFEIQIEDVEGGVFTVKSDKTFPQSERVQIQGTVIGPSALFQDSIVEGGQLELIRLGIEMPKPEEILAVGGLERWKKKIGARIFRTPEITKVTLSRVSDVAEEKGE